MSSGICLCEIDDQPELPDDLNGMCYYQNMAAERQFLEIMNTKKVSKLEEMVAWNEEDPEYLPASAILKEAEKIKNWLDKNEDWEEFIYGREGFLEDLEEMLQVLRFAAKKNYQFGLSVD
jgi:hypothetical protein